MPRPLVEPLGLQVSRTAKVLARTFDDELDAAGGSLPMWLVLVGLKAQGSGRQRDLAAAVGVEGPTLTHHLNKMEAAGLLCRTRDPEDRRLHHVTLTEAGEALFTRLRAAASGFDRRLRIGVTDDEVAVLGDLLARLRGNAAAAEVAP